MRRIVRTRAVIAGMALLLLALGCLPSKGLSRPAMFHANPQHTGVYETWGVTGAGGLKWRFKAGKRVFSSPAIANGRVYFGSEDGSLYVVR